MEWRNPVYTDSGDIDCEVNHPQHGWIATTVTQSDNPDLFGSITSVGGIGAYVVPPPEPISSAQVNEERSRRVIAGTVVSVAGITDGVALQGRPEDRTNLLGLLQIANMRIAQGDTTTLTTFRDRDNTEHHLTPEQVVEMVTGGLSYTETVYQASWVLKAQDPIPTDYADNTHWPAAS